VSSLSTENAEFKAKVELLRSENLMIKEQLVYLRNFISSAISLSFPNQAALMGGPQGSNPFFQLPPLPGSLQIDGSNPSSGNIQQQSELSHISTDTPVNQKSNET
jgi:hypothetical protein